MRRGPKGKTLIQGWVNMARASLFSCSSVLGVSALALLSQESAMAQGLPSAAIEEIVVTAQKRSEKLQQAAASITAFNDAALKAKNIVDLEALTYSEPSVHVSQGEQRVTINIRGINAGAQIGFAEQAVATHVDGFYVARPTALLGDFLDVERVEVVKGPQGTLYGRNATAGAINIITKKPTDDFELQLNGQLLWITNNGGGGGMGSRIELIGNAPLGEGVRARIAIAKENRDGAFTRIDEKDQTHDVADRNDLNARFQLQADLASNLTWTGLADLYFARDQGAFLNATVSDVPGVPLTAVEVFGGRHNDYSRRIYSDRSTPSRPLVYGFGSTFDWKVSDTISLKSLTGYRYTRLNTAGDIDGTDYDLTYYHYNVVSKQWTQELQAQFDFGKVKGLMGLYYFDEKGDLDQRFDLGLPALGSTSPDLLLLLNGRGHSKAWAAFGEFNVQATDTLDLTLGGRYSEERKSGQQAGLFSFVDRFGTDAFDITNDATLSEKKFSSFTPRAVIRYRPTELITAYASASKGFKSGGYNIGSLDQNTPFDDEKLTAFEAGFKSELFGRRLLLNLSAFYYDYKNLQVEDSIATSTIIRNAAKARIKGLEGQVRLQATDAFSIDGSFTVLDARFTKGVLTNPLTGVAVDIDGNRLPKSAKFSGALAVQYRFETKAGATIVPVVTASYQGKRYFTVFNGPIDNQPSYVWLRATLTYTSPEKVWSVALFADNITNKFVLSQAYNDLNYRSLMASVAPPRTVGIRFGYNF